MASRPHDAIYDEGQEETDFANRTVTYQTVHLQFLPIAEEAPSRYPSYHIANQPEEVRQVWLRDYVLFMVNTRTFAQQKSQIRAYFTVLGSESLRTEFIAALYDHFAPQGRLELTGFTKLIYLTGPAGLSRAQRQQRRQQLEASGWLQQALWRN